MLPLSRIDLLSEIRGMLDRGIEALSFSDAATAATSSATVSAATTHSAAVAGSVTEKSMPVGGFVAVGAALAL